MSNLKERLEREVDGLPISPGGLERALDRARRRNRNRRIRAAVVALAIAVIPLAVALGGRDLVDDATGVSAEGTTSPPAPTGRTDYLVDLETGETAPLPESVAGGYCYRVSPDGTMLTYQAGAPGVEEGIYVANLDGSDVRLVSGDGVDARCPDWSPDGSKIVYQAFVPTPKLGNLFTFDLTSDETKQITDLEQRDVSFYAWMNPTFSSDGEAILYHIARVVSPEVKRDIWSVPVAGGEPTLVRKNSSFGVNSPNDDRLAYVPAVGEWTAPEIKLAGLDSESPSRTLVKGTDVGWPRWSPDGSKIAYIDSGEVFIVEPATGEVSKVEDVEVSLFDYAEWYDDQTLIIDVY